MTSSLFDRIRGIAADVLEVPPGQITPQASSESIASWDSVHHLNFILALEQEFKLRFEPAEIDQMTSIERVLGVLNKHAGETS